MKNWVNRRAGRRGWLIALLALVLLLPSWTVFAQDSSPEGPGYLVQSGDTLWTISLRFGVSVDELKSANGIGENGWIEVGETLTIPGIVGFNGILTTQTVTLGDNLRSLSRRSGVDRDVLSRINRLVNPGGLYVGASLILPETEESLPSGSRVVLASGQSLLELAVLNRENPWKMAAQNQIEGLWSPLPGDVFYTGITAAEQGLTPVTTPAADGGGEQGEISAGEIHEPGALPGFIESLSLKPLTLEQGRVAAIEILGPEGMSLSGALGDATLHFFPNGAGNYVALQGIHAMTDAGLYTLSLEGSLAGSEGIQATPFAFSQPVFITEGGYVYDPVLTVSPETIDPAITQPEDAEWKALAQNVSEDKLWMGVFQSPAPPEFSDCWPSTYGNRRSYNGSAYDYFHTGLDFCGGVGTDIFAPADGVVVFAGPLTVRGNATMIDHGWGVYTGYMHQSEILVQVGEQVQAGQVIGKVGATGRVTGPHLHWEVFVGGIQVDPMQWLEEAIP